MNELIARIEKATGPDREIDGAIAKHFRSWVLVQHPRGWDGPSEEAPWYTASLDSVVALVEWELPDVYYEIHRYKNGTVRAVIEDCIHSMRHPPATMPTPALALLLAFLRAKSNQGAQ